MSDEDSPERCSWTTMRLWLLFGRSTGLKFASSAGNYQGQQLHNNCELPNQFVGRHRKPTGYGCETGGQRSVRINGKWAMECHMIRGADHGEGVLATGRREECNGLQELNGNRRGNGRSGGG